MTTEEFITQARLIHGKKFNYPTPNFLTKKDKIHIICEKGHEFFQSIRYHLDRKQGCPQCRPNNKLSQNEFIDKISKLHHQLDFSSTIYVRSSDKVNVICPQHGNFFIKPNKLQQGQGCPKCSRENTRISLNEMKERFKLIDSNNNNILWETFQGNDKEMSFKCCKHGIFSSIPHYIIQTGYLFCNKGCSKLAHTNDEFITLSKQRFGNVFNYDYVDYINLETNVKLICNKGHVFYQRPDGHLKGSGCPICIGRGCDYTIDGFLSKVREKHNDKYDLSQIRFDTLQDKIDVICPLHGLFIMRAINFLRGSGCHKCGKECRVLSQNEFINRLENIFLDRYDFSKTVYNRSCKTVKVICKKHGLFSRKASLLLIGMGCTKCSLPEGEIIIENFFIRNKIRYIHNKTFPGCKIKRLLRFDFYLPDYNCCIEYDGIGHFKPIFGQKSFKFGLQSDRTKNEFCHKQGIQLIRINRKDFIEPSLINLIYPMTI